MDTNAKPVTDFDKSRHFDSLRLQVPETATGEKGFLARLRGEPATACPSYKTTDPASRWHQGWKNADQILNSLASVKGVAEADVVDHKKQELWLWVKVLAEVVGALAAVVAGFLLWQQVNQQSMQIQQQSTQIQQQATDNLIARRAQLLDTIFTVDCGDSDEPENCRPALRARTEAAIAFVEIERSRGQTRPDLHRADLRGGNLAQADLHGINLSRANLSEAILAQTDLSMAHLGSADLSGANLSSADLHRAYLGSANLSQSDLLKANLLKANLTEANLSGANLLSARIEGSNLLGADLHDAKNLGPANLADTCGDKETQLPEGVTIPDTWPCIWKPDESGEWIRVRLPNEPLSQVMTRADDIP